MLGLLQRSDSVGVGLWFRWLNSRAGPAGSVHPTTSRSQHAFFNTNLSVVPTLAPFSYSAVCLQIVGSLMYFQRALVVSAAATIHGPAFRTTFFAALNTWSAAAILLMQVCGRRWHVNVHGGACKGGCTCL